MTLRWRFRKKLNTLCSCVFEGHVEVWVTVNDCDARAPQSLNSTHQFSVDLNNDQGHYLGRKSWGAIPSQENSVSKGAPEVHDLCGRRQVV